MDPKIAWFLVIAVAIVLGYLLVMRVFFRESRRLDRNIDFSRMKKWEEDEEEK